MIDAVDRWSNDVSTDQVVQERYCERRQRTRTPTAPRGAGEPTFRAEEVTVTTRTQFTFRVDTWTPDGESIVKHVAGVEDYQVALATYSPPNAGRVRRSRCAGALE